MKLTESIIDQLIAEQIEKLDERDMKVRIGGVPKLDGKDDDQDYRNSIATDIEKDDLYDLTNLDTKKGRAILTPQDLAIAFDPASTASQDAKDGAEKLASDGQGKIKDVAVAIKKAKGLKDVSDIDTTADVKVARPDSIAFGALQTISADPTAGNVGAFPEGIATAAKSVFGGLNNLEDRLLKLDQLVDLVYDDQGTNFSKNLPEIVNAFQSIPKVLAAILVLDYFTTVVKEMDSGAAAYQFEALLALLSGGAVKGKAKTTSGKMAAVDFVTNQGHKGSSKYSSKLDSSVKQARAGFDEGEPYFYIIAHKKGEDDTFISKGESDPREIFQINIYTITVVKVGEEHFYIRNRDGKVFYQKVSGDVKLAKKEYMVNPIKIRVSPDTAAIKSFKDQLTHAVTANTATNISGYKDAIAKLTQMSQASYQMDQKLKAYASTGNVAKGDEALEQIVQIENDMATIVPLLSTGKKYDKKLDKSQAKINENNLENILDKLIQEVILTK